MSSVLAINKQLRKVEMHKAIICQTNFARYLATPVPQPSEQKQQQFCKSQECREANPQSSLNEESTSSVIVRRNPESRLATGLAASISNRDSSSLDAADNANPSPNNCCNLNRDSLIPIVPNEAVSLEVHNNVEPRVQVVESVLAEALPEAPMPHQQQDKMGLHVVPEQGVVQEHDQAGLNVGQPTQVEPAMVGPQAGMPLQQQDVVQQQQLAFAERTMMQAADAQSEQAVAEQQQPVAHEIEEVSEGIIFWKPTQAQYASSASPKTIQN